jgi:hypothetical protein
MKKNIFIFLVLFFAELNIQSQDCLVVADSLKGKYEGGCRNGKAYGKGNAKGVDSYEGDFVNGYPDGEGKYTWKSGSWYDGQWKKGKFNGSGTLHRAEININDSNNLTGYWKEGMYIGKYENPYLIRLLTNEFEEVNVKKLKSGKDITVTVKSTTGGALSLGTISGLIQVPKCKLTAVMLQNGNFERRTDDESTSSITNRYLFHNVDYPFCAIFVFENGNLQSERMQVEIFESAGWNIDVKLNK